jgi:hypothetical protein
LSFPCVFIVEYPVVFRYSQRLYFFVYCNLNVRHAAQYAALLAPYKITLAQIKKRCRCD